MTSSALRAVSVLMIAGMLSSCSTSTTTSAATTTNAYATAYQNAKFNNGSSGNMTVSFPSSCSMTVSGTGVPYSHAVYYLAPVMNGGTVVATTPSGIQLGLMTYAGTGISTSIKAVSATFNICPTKAASTTATGGGPIGLMFAGTSLFDPYEATSTVALADNASYTFASTACGGSTCTASFIDTCNEHPTGGSGGSTWHFHGVPTCWTSVVDGSSGPSHIIGIALDGFPIYGGYDVNGVAVNVSALDACNGITSATPEFPGGAYHYVLPVGVTSARSSIGCYAGTVDATLSAAMQRLGCKMPMMLANGKARLPDGREVSVAEAEVWMKQTMPGMDMGPGMVMPGVKVASGDGGGRKRMGMAGM